MSKFLDRSISYNRNSASGYLEQTFRDGLAERGNILLKGYAKLSLNAPTKESLKKYSIQRGSRSIRLAIKNAIENHSRLVIRYKGAKKADNYLIEPLEIRLVRTKGGGRTFGVYAKNSNGEFRLFFLKNILVFKEYNVPRL